MKIHKLLLALLACTALISAGSLEAKHKSSSCSCPYSGKKEYEKVKACEVKANNATATEASIGEASIDIATVGQAAVDSAAIVHASIGEESVGSAEIGQATISQATIDQATIDQAVISQATIESLRVKEVDNDIGATYVVGVDVPTIQAGIDLASSGLKPDSALSPPLPQGAKNVTIAIPPGLYHETLFIDTSLSDPTINDPGTDLTNLQGRGLRLIGDTRPIAAMTYMNGGLVRTNTSFLANSGVNSLGTLNSVVALSNAGNTITVSTTPGPQPDFGACGVIAGDIIIVTDNTGTFQERTVTSVLGNTVTYAGGPVTITGKGAALTFCPNVQVMASQPDAQCYVVSGAVEMVGIWFSMDPALAASSVYGVAVEDSGIIYASQILGDARNLTNTQDSFFTFAGGQFLVNLADGSISGHISSVGGRLETSLNSVVEQGHWYVMAPPSMPFGCLLMLQHSQVGPASFQINGAAKTAAGLNISTETQFRTQVFTAFNCTTACSVAQNADAGLSGYMLIDTCTTGVSGAFSNTILEGTGTFAGLTSTINNCTTGIRLDLGGRFETGKDLIISNCTTGVNATRQSRFGSGGALTFTGTTTPMTISSGSIVDTATSNVATITSSTTRTQGLFDYIDTNDADPLLIGSQSGTSVSLARTGIPTIARSDLFTQHWLQVSPTTGTLGAHIRTQQNTKPLMSAGGDVASATLTGSDLSGKIAGTTTAGSASGSIAVTFSESYGVAPEIFASTIVPSGGGAVTNISITNVTTTGFTLNFTTPAGAGTSFQVNYLVIEAL